MKKLLIGIVAVLMLVGLTGCQWGAKNLGGSYTVELPKNQKLVNVTWKENNLWYLTRPMTDEDVAETYTFGEDSTLGVLEGTVTIKESKDGSTSMDDPINPKRVAIDTPINPK